MASRYFGTGESGAPDHAGGAAPTRDDVSPEMSPASIGGEPRMALLVGNQSYAHNKLSNPVNDVRLIGETLKALGFEVSTLENADRARMLRAVVNFCVKLEQAGPEAVAIFYFAGHGIQHEGTNYLVPVGADIPTSRHLSVSALKVDDIVAELARSARKANVIVLDACRINPLPNMTSGNRDVTQGLASLSLPSAGWLVAYSTAAGDVAEDGAGTISPYADALVAELPGLLEPGRRVHDVFVQTADRVRAVTDGKQSPALYLQGALPPLILSQADLVRLEGINTTRDIPVTPNSLSVRASRAWARLPRSYRITAVAGVLAAAGLLAGLPTWSTIQGVRSDGRVGTFGFDKSGPPAGERNRLWWYLANEFPASSTPVGYTFSRVEPYCCIERKEKEAGIGGYARVVFTRPGLAQTRAGDEQAWEGFNYFVFDDSAGAPRYSIPESEAIALMKMMHGSDEAIQQRYNSRSWRGRKTVTYKPPTGPAFSLNCIVADTLIGCHILSSNPRVMVQLLLQEPRLRSASATSRDSLIDERVKAGITSLLRAAEEHVKWAGHLAQR